MNEEPFLALAPFAFYLLGACLAYIDRKPPATLSHLAALGGSLVGVAVATWVLLTGSTIVFAMFSVAPFATLSFRLDPLAAFFVLVISIVAIATCIYALGYLDDEHGSIAGLGVALNGFLAMMILVVLANSAFTFLVAWEAMSLVSLFLVIHHYQQADVRRAGFVYLAMTHAGTAFLLVAFFLLFGASGSLEFDVLRSFAPTLPAATRDLVFLLVLVAFGTKAGVVPLHVWLPLAHPAAPSHVSALMSGVMIKTAIYGLVRVAGEFIAPGPPWWGILLLSVGAGSAILGVLYALMERDLKRLLAYCSVENIGVVLIGLGAAFLLMPLGYPALASLALMAALYHVLNHAVFKALLFMGAGAIQRATHTRDLEALGGLIHRMPWTAGTFLVGAVAISSLPPLNGFVSEWLTFQSLLHLSVNSHWPAVSVGAAGAAGVLALTGGLAAFCFVKAFGIAFLGSPRGLRAREAKEANGPMVAAMVLLAVLCFALALLPGVVTRLLAPVTQSIYGIAAQPSLGMIPLPEITPGASLAPATVLLLVITFGGFALLIGRLLGGPERRRTAIPWGCGIDLEPAMQYSASALSKPIRIIFRAVVRPYRSVERVYRGGGSYFVAAVRYDAGLHPIFDRYLYGPVVRSLLLTAQQVRAVQSGSLRAYLAYIFVTLVIVLVLAR